MRLMTPKREQKDRDNFPLMTMITKSDVERSMESEVCASSNLVVTNKVDKEGVTALPLE
jgi:hypothetical protein